MAKELGDMGRGPSEEFVASLKRRSEAAKGLEGDLLTEVPLLYGSPGALEPKGDPGSVLAEIHRKELVRRNGSGVLHSSRNRSAVTLPFERTLGALALLLCLLVLFGRLD